MIRFLFYFLFALHIIPWKWNECLHSFDNACNVWTVKFMASFSWRHFMFCVNGLFCTNYFIFSRHRCLIVLDILSCVCVCVWMFFSQLFHQFYDWHFVECENVYAILLTYWQTRTYVLRIFDSIKYTKIECFFLFVLFFSHYFAHDFACWMYGYFFFFSQKPIKIEQKQTVKVAFYLFMR